jgi:outer membrane protein TolC
MGVPQDNMWSASVGFMLPVFAARRELSMGAEMDAMARASESELRAATLDLEQQVEATHAAARAGQRIVALLADTVVTTQRRAVEASWAAYTAGAADLWRVFEATHTLYGEEVALTRVRQDLARTEARLLAITARGDLLGVDLPNIPRSER